MIHSLRSWAVVLLCFMPSAAYTADARDSTPAAAAVQKPKARQQPTVGKSAKSPSISLQGLERPSLVIQGGALVFMSLLPFFIMILTSFVKIVVVLSLLRSALGVQQAPPNQVINGVAFLLSMYVT